MQFLHAASDLLWKCLEYVYRNPPVAAALIAAIVAIVVARTTLHGVRLSLKASEEKTARELGHSVEQENRDREFTREQARQERLLDSAKERHSRLTAMRREVYLEAIVELAKFQAFLGGLAQTGLETAPANPAGELSVAVGRVTLVAEEATVFAARRQLNAVMRVYFNCLQRLIQAEPFNAVIEECRRQQQGAAQRRDSYLEQMREYNLATRNDPKAFDAIKRQFELALEEHEKASAMLGAAYGRKAIFQLEYAEALHADLVVHVVEGAEKLAAAIRAELELETDVDAFLASSREMQEQSAQAMKAIEKMLQKQ